MKLKNPQKWADVQLAGPGPPQSGTLNEQLVRGLLARQRAPRRDLDVRNTR